MSKGTSWHALSQLEKLAELAQGVSSLIRLKGSTLLGGDHAGIKAGS